MSLKLIHRHPLLRALITLALGIYSYKLFDATISSISLLIIGLGLIVNLYFLKHPHYSFQPIQGALLILIIYLFGGLWANLMHTELIPEKGNCIVKGYVTRISKIKEDETKAEFYADTLKIGEIAYYNIKGMIALDVDSCGIEPGDIIYANGQIRKPTVTLFDSFNYTDYLENQGLHYEIYVSDYKKAEKQKWCLSTIIGKIQSTVSERLSKCGISEDNMPLLQALFLGDKSRLDNDLRSDFSICGTVHILAVSGMHVGIIYMFLSFIFNLIFFRCRRASSWLTIIGVWFYAIIAGMSPPIFRASIMISVYELIRYHGRQACVYDCVWFAMFIILLAQPFSLFTVGFWLSFSAVLGIVALYRPAMQVCPFTFPIWRFVYQSTTVTCAAQLATSPFILYTFHTFPTYFIINNLIIVPLASPIIIGTLLILIISCFTMWGGLVIGGAVDDILTFVREYVGMASQWPNATIDNIRFSFPEMLALTILIITISYLANWGEFKNFRRTTTAFLILCLTITIFDVNARQHSDIIIYETYGRMNIVVNDRGNMTHLQTDIQQTKTNVTAQTLERMYRTTETTAYYLYDGTLIITPYDTLYVVASNKYYDQDIGRSVDIICNDVMSQTENNSGTSIISSRIKNTNIVQALDNDVYEMSSRDDETQHCIIIENGEKKNVSLQD